MKCFYHSADLDGHCSGAIIKNLHPECEMIGINYGQEFPFDTVAKDEIVYMVDFCLQPFDLMEKLNSICQLIWIDHHKTAIDEAYDKGFIARGGQLIRDGMAGCELVWEYEYQHQKTVNKAVYLLGRYDVWDHYDPETLPFQYGMRMIGDTLPGSEIWKELFNNNDLTSEIITTGKIVIEYERQQNIKFCRAYSFETAIEKDGQSLSAICINRGLTNSQIFDSVYNPEKHDLMITFCRLKPPAGKWTVSLYSTKNEIDCGTIAKSFGGGGHKGAAGFQCVELPFTY